MSAMPSKKRSQIFHFVHIIFGPLAIQVVITADAWILEHVEERSVKAVADPSASCRGERSGLEPQVVHTGRHGKAVEEDTRAL